jgi:Cu/Ag efflux protein CusF
MPSVGGRSNVQIICEGGGIEEIDVNNDKSSKVMMGSEIGWLRASDMKTTIRANCRRAARMPWPFSSHRALRCQVVRMLANVSYGNRCTLAVGKTALRAARVMLAVVTVMATISSQALAERTVRGVVVKVDGMAGIISVREMHSGLAGAISYGMVEKFKVKDGLLFDAVRLGDEVVFSASEMNGAMTITKLSEQ